GVVTITAGSGLCAVTASAAEGTNYLGSSATAQTIAAIKATAPVVLSDLTPTYTGSPLTPTATPTPAGLTIVWTGAPQTTAGSYAVVATINDANYEGTISGTLVIGKAASTTSFTSVA